MFRLMIFHAVFQRNRFRGLRLSNGRDSDVALDAAAQKRQLLQRNARKYISQLSDPELMHICEFFEFQSSVCFWLLHKLADSRESL